MTPTAMKVSARAAASAGTRMILVLRKGFRPPAGFPRGKLLCENHDGSRVRSYDPQRVLKWLAENFPAAAQ